MTLAQLPTQSEPLIDDAKKITLPWQAALDAIVSGDLGSSWTPTFVGLTISGTPTIIGRYYKISQKLAYFRITITPATSTTAVLGTTYCDNFPLTIANNGASMTCSGYTAAPAGVTSSDKRIYVAAWSAITSAITITGTIEVQ